MTQRRTLMGMLGGAAMALGLANPVAAQEYSYNLQSFLPAQATVPNWGSLYLCPNMVAVQPAQSVPNPWVNPTAVATPFGGVGR